MASSGSAKLPLKEWSRCRLGAVDNTYRIPPIGAGYVDGS
jgi:hypothetical protein